jgi:hypothetical protein
MDKYQVAIEKFDDNYNIHKFFKEDIIEIYIEKVGYAHLYYVAGLVKNIELQQNYIQQFIDVAESENFWGID